MNMDKIEEYLESLEELIYSSLDAASPGYIKETINQLWIDITRYGPTLPNIPEMRFPGLGDFEVPLPPPPPPPPRSLYERSWAWVEKHPWKAASFALGVVGGGLLVGYGGVYMKTVRTRKVLKSSSSNDRRQVVVVLGGDTPLGHPLVLDLERKGYIVVASVSGQDAADALERKCHGYVRALVLDPSEPETIPLFLRSLSSTLSRRFPITSAGDPFASPASHPYIHSVVSLLTLPPLFTHAPLEHISFQDNYLSYLTQTQITPLQVIQSLLPLLRHVPSSGKKTIIVCLPATETRFGLPFSSVQSMSAVSTMRAVEVLRREISVAAMAGKSETMKNIRVVAIEVGAFNVGSQRPQHFTPLEAMEKWTASEKITYGPAFAAIIDSAHSERRAVHRRPTEVKVFVNNLLAIVSNGQLGGSSASFLRWLTRPRWTFGERFSVGAGAQTYRLASHLPTLLLDTMLNIPHFLISIRTALLPSQPFVLPRPVMKPRADTSTTGPGLDEESGSGNDVEPSETGSEADVESNSSGDGSGVDSSWVTLKEEKEERPSAT